MNIKVGDRVRLIDKRDLNLEYGSINSVKLGEIGRVTVISDEVLCVDFKGIELVSVLLDEIELVEEPVQTQTIKDSGERKLFDSGAVRDTSQGKGRMDLVPLDVISTMFNHDLVFGYMDDFQSSRDIDCIYDILDEVIKEEGRASWVLELSKHFEQGAAKYAERNWEKGIPISGYVDSAMRHYLKHLDGQTDENHFIAFTWNLVCLIWTMKNIGDDE